MAYLVHCEDCNKDFEVDKWTPGMKCPLCEKTRTRPIGKIDNTESPTVTMLDPALLAPLVQATKKSVWKTIITILLSAAIGAAVGIYFVKSLKISFNIVYSEQRESTTEVQE